MMKWIVYVSDFFVPILLFYFIAYGLLSKQNVYDQFIDGAKDGFQTVIKITPTILGLMVAVGVLRASGALEILSKWLAPVGKALHIPIELIPVFFVRLFSASAGNGFVFDIFKEYGTDSFAGLSASIMMSCTETVFYTMSLYYMATKVIKTRYTLKGAMIATTAGAIASIILANYIV